MAPTKPEPNTIDIPWTSPGPEILSSDLLKRVRKSILDLPSIHDAKIFSVSAERAVVRVITDVDPDQLLIDLGSAFPPEFVLSKIPIATGGQPRLVVTPSLDADRSQKPNSTSTPESSELVRTPISFPKVKLPQFSVGTLPFWSVFRHEEDPFASAWSRRTTLLAISLSLLVWFLLPPVFQFKSVPWGVDQWGHLTRLELLREAVAGDLSLPMWIPHWYSGQDLWQYYPPLTYFVLLPTALIAGNALDGYTMAAAPLTALMTVGLFWALRPWLGTFNSFIAALVFTLTPLTLAQFYGVGHIAWGIQQVILVINIGLLLRALRAPTAVNLALYGLTVGLMIPAHSMTALMTMMATVPLATGLWIGSFTNFRNVVITGTAGVFGAGISAVWLIPGVTHIDLEEIPWLAIDKVIIWSGSPWFTDRSAAIDTIDSTGIVATEYIGLSITLMAIIGCLVGLTSPRTRALSLGLGMMTLAMFIVGQGIRTPFYEFIPLSESLLPNRAFNIMILGMVILMAIGIKTAIPYAHVKIAGTAGQKIRLNLAVVASIVIMLGLAVEYMPWWIDRSPENFNGDEIYADLTNETEDIWAIGRYWDITPVNDSFQPYSITLADRQSAIGWANEGTLHISEFTLTGPELIAGRPEGLIRRADIYNSEFVWVESVNEGLVDGFVDADYELVKDTGFKQLMQKPQDQGYLLELDRNVLAVGSAAPLLATIYPNISLGSYALLDDYFEEYLAHFDTIAVVAPGIEESPDELAAWIDKRLEAGQRVVLDLWTPGAAEAAGITALPITLAGTQVISYPDGTTAEIGPFDQVGGPFFTSLPAMPETPIANIVIEGETTPFIGYKSVGNGELVVLPFAMVFHSFNTRDNETAQELIGAALGIPTDEAFRPHPRLKTNLIEGGTNNLDVEFVSQNSEYVMISMTYSPHWNLTVNGEKREVVRHENMMAFRADQGQNVVEFTYAATPIQKISLALSVLALVGLVSTAYVGPKYIRFNGPQALMLVRYVFVSMPSWLFQEQKKISTERQDDDNDRSDNKSE